MKVLLRRRHDDAIQGEVQPGDKVIVDGQLRVVPGAACIVENGSTQRTPRLEPPGGMRSTP